MKTLKKIEFYHKRNRHSEPELLYAAQAEAPNRNPRFFTNISSKHSDSTSYQLNINVFKDGRRNEFKYWVCQYFCNGDRIGEIARTRSYIPLVGAAFPLSNDQENSSGGQLFSFLPLPLAKTSPTGLNIHLNGYFALDQNRRHLKLNAAGQDARTDPELLWNQLLILELIPTCLANLIKTFCQQSHLDKMKVSKAKDITSTFSLCLDN